MAQRKGWKGESKRHSLARKGIKTKQKVNEAMMLDRFAEANRPQPKKQDGRTTFYRDVDGKISNTRLSPYGKRQRDMLQGEKLYFDDNTLTLKGDELVDEQGKTILVVDNDRMVNKIIFKVMF